MHRRAFLRGIAGSVALAPVGAVEAHPGPYRPFGSVAVENAREAVVDEDGEYAYLAADDGIAVVDVSPPHLPEVVAEDRTLLADRETGPLSEIQDVKVEGDRLVAAGPANPKPGDVLQGLLLYDVSDPENPKRIAFHETEFPIHNCDISEGFVYLTGNDGEANPLVVVDVRDGNPEEIGRWSLLDLDGQWGKVAAGLRTLHDVWVQDGRAYLAHWDAGTYILDVSDPSNPSFVSRIGGRPLDELVGVPDDQVGAQAIRLPGNAHYAMANEDGTLLGVNKEAWEAEGRGGPGGVELWDVSDVANPMRLTTIDAPESADASIRGTWTTSHNFDIVGDRLFTSWYQGGVKIHDVSDPANPTEMAWWRTPEQTAFWTAKRATSQFFVASSVGDYLEGVDGEAGLYTFPIEEDVQKDPPPLTTAAESNTGTTTTETTMTETTTTRIPTTTEQAAFAGETTTTTGSAGGTPGFGSPAALAALLGAGAWRTLRD